MNKDVRIWLELVAKVGVFVSVLTVAAFFTMPYASYVTHFLQPNGGIVHGQVIGPNGPVNGFGVNIYHPSSNSIYATVSWDTAGGGWYSIDLPTGVGYVIYKWVSCSPEHSGMTCLQGPVTFNIGNGTTLTINIYLYKEAASN